ncbi:uncharacterized protein LOC120558307 isoform X3 [Perca fluviatilis]|uniref:uncharacterized protein LOC120558307 isoform X3 n=1 Tax=Perca fluviatilis TaxID=8168 RepID=UPI001965B303|nr:uncharacterized protein LOC120558307 isoform X3 [Perca fluviatilis]
MESPSPSSASLSTVAVKEKVGVPSSDQLLEDPRKEKPMASVESSKPFHGDDKWPPLQATRKEAIASMESPGPSSASLGRVAVKEKVGVPSSDQPLEDPRKISVASSRTSYASVTAKRPPGSLRKEKPTASVESSKPSHADDKWPPLQATRKRMVSVESSKLFHADEWPPLKATRKTKHLESQKEDCAADRCKAGRARYNKLQVASRWFVSRPED